MSPQRFGILARGSHGDLCRALATVRSAVGQVSEMRDTRVHARGCRLFLFLFTFWRQSWGSLMGAMWGLRKRHPEWGFGLSSTDRLNYESGSQMETDMLRGSWINESGVEGQGVDLRIGGWES